MKVIWKNQIIADYKDSTLIEKEQYFPHDFINKESLEDSKLHTTCTSLAKASYNNIVVKGKYNNNVAWYYSKTKDSAYHICGMTESWKIFEIIE